MDVLMPQANELFKSGDYAHALNKYRLLQRRSHSIKKPLEILIAECIFRLTDYAKAASNRVSEVDVTLTTISSRLHLTKQVVFTLLNQSILPRNIYLNISEEPYLLDNGISSDNDDLQELKNLSRVKVQWVKNTGPYRKILPYFENALTDESCDIFITADDDTLYPYYFIETLLNEHLKTGCVVAFRGRKVVLDGCKSKVASYSSWEKGVTKASVANLPTGKDGVIYKKSFFTPEFLNYNAAFKIAPTADDLWIKWNTALNGVESIILNPNASASDFESFPVVDFSDDYRDISLFRAHNSQKSEGRNDRSIQKLEEYFGNLYGYQIIDLIASEG